MLFVGNAYNCTFVQAFKNYRMNAILQHDLNDLENILNQAKQQSLDFLNDLENIPTSTKNTIDPTRNLDEEGLGSLAALKEFK